MQYFETELNSITKLIREVRSIDFISYNDLSDRLYVTEGDINPVDHGWLEFNSFGKTLLVSKQNVRTDITWTKLYLAGVVGGNNPDFKHPTNIGPIDQHHPLLIKGKKYIVRLLQGAIDDEFFDIQGHNLPGIIDCEWNKLFYPIVETPFFLKERPRSLFPYRTEDVQMSQVGSWVQEIQYKDSPNRLVRGQYGPSYLSWGAASAMRTYHGWRPCLELIE